VEKWPLPEGWEWKPLGSVVLQTEQTNPHQNPDETFTYIEISSIERLTGKIGEPRTITGKEAPSRARKVVATDDVIFATTRPYLRNIALVPQEYDGQVCSTGFCVLRANPHTVLPEWLYHLCRAPFMLRKIEPLMHGATYPAITDSELRSVEIPIPLLDTQRRIVARVEALFAELTAARCTHAALVHDAERLMDAVIQDVFHQSNSHWKTSLLSEIAFIQTGTAKGRRFGDRGTIELPYLRVANVQAGYLDLNEVKTIPIAADEVNRYELQPGDLLLTEGGDHDKLGRGAVWEGQIIPCIHQNHIFAVRFDPDVILPRFAKYEMQSWHAKSYFLRVAKKTTNLATINKTKLGKFPLRYPAITEQQVIVAHLDAVQAHTAELQRTAAALAADLDRTEQAILAQAFRGKV